jgi:2-polyprenyl-3-methyl-5-hydroxy-6-metoxy-1,4-benzoquinol methylase
MRIAAHLGNDAPAPVSPTIAWEECDCRLCGCAKYSPLLEAPDPYGGGLRFLVVKCEHCGLCYTNPRPDRVSIQQFYPAQYQCHRGKEDIVVRKLARGKWQKAIRRKKSDPIPRLLQVQTPCRLLDFGCGAGDFLWRMHALGWNVTGVDMAQSAVVRLREQYGLPAHAGTLPHPLLTAASFEVITMRQSLEHVHQPLDVLEAAYRLLTRPGRLLVAVPNFDSLASRWFGAAWYGLDLPRHLTHFTPQTLRTMLGRAGFEDVELRQERRSSWIRHSARGFLNSTCERGDHRNQGALSKSNLMTDILRTRLGAGLAGWWGRLVGRADCLIAVATKR